jgi:hypothetical protein
MASDGGWNSPPRRRAGVAIVPMPLGASSMSCGLTPGGEVDDADRWRVQSCSPREWIATPMT